jgi:hypothetical protein
MKIMEAQIDRNPVRVVAVPGHMAQEYWPNVERFANQALEYACDGMTVQTVLEMIVDGRLILIVVTDANDEPIASMTFEVVQQARRKICHCMTLGGDDLEQWVETFVGVWRAVALELGCDAVTIKGRAGWERYAKRFGFEHQYTIMTLPIGV